MSASRWRDEPPVVRRRPALQHQGAVVDVGISGDARVLGSVGADGWLRLSNLQRGLAGFAVELAAPGEHLVVGASLSGVAVGNQVHLFNTLAGVEVGVIRGRGRVTALAMSGDGVLVCIGDERGQIRLHRAVTGRRVARLQLSAAVESMRFGPDDDVLCVVCDGRASWYRLSDLDPASPVCTVNTRGPGAPCWRRRHGRKSAWFWSDEEALWSFDQTLHDAPRTRVGEPLDDLWMDATGRHLLGVRPGVIWTPSGEKSQEPKSLLGPLALHPCGQCVAVGDADGHIVWWRTSPWSLWPVS